MRACITDGSSRSRARAMMPGRNINIREEGREERKEGRKDGRSRLIFRAHRHVDNVLMEFAEREGGGAGAKGEPATVYIPFTRAL